MAATVIECIRSGCGAPKEVSGRGRPALFCSERCRVAYARQKARPIGDLDRLAEGARRAIANGADPLLTLSYVIAPTARVAAALEDVAA